MDCFWFYGLVKKQSHKFRERRCVDQVSHICIVFCVTWEWDAIVVEIVHLISGGIDCHLYMILGRDPNHNRPLTLDYIL